MNTKPIRFLRRGKPVTLHNVPPNRTLLEVLREDLACTGTKEGCGEGDCGACTVVVGQAHAGTLRYSAINSCIRMAHSIDGMALWTVEDISGARPAPAEPAGGLAALHPAQAALVRCHGSQCGFCTPGFVMSLFGLYQNQRGAAVTREAAQHAISGNLCRCTGYRPILDAAQSMHVAGGPTGEDRSAPAQACVDEAQVLLELKRMAKALPAPQADSAYLAPRTLAQLLAARTRHPKAQLVAGCTDVGLWVTKQHLQVDHVIDLTQVRELRRVEHYRHHLAIGAAVTLTDAFAALVADRPSLEGFLNRFAGLTVRNTGTLGGNVANGSPIGDSMPLLIALGASVVLMSERGHREMRLEDLYTGYRRNVLAPDEVLAWIKVPKAVAAAAGTSAARAQGTSHLLRAYKISKRFEDDISAVCLALSLDFKHGVVQKASIGVGGMAATPMRARQTEARLVGQTWNAACAQRAAESLRAEFSPISDMRASASYRSQVIGNLLQRFWLESQGLHPVSLDHLKPGSALPLGASA